MRSQSASVGTGSVASRASTSDDVVIAACPSRGSLMRQIAWTYFRLLTGFRLEDLTSGFRYYNARACRLLAGESAEAGVAGRPVPLLYDWADAERLYAEL